MPICKNCGVSNKKVILDYTPKSYTVCPDPGICPDKYSCSEILDAACVQYTSTNISYCGASYIVIDKFDSLEIALQRILDILCDDPPRCALEVEIIPNESDDETPTLSSTVSNGQAPYTYKWEIAQGDFVGHFISGPTTLPTLNLTCIASKAITTGNVDKNIKISNIQLTVTDSRGCKKIMHFLYASDCYAMIVNEPEPRQQFLGGRISNSNGSDTPFAFVPMSFMDDPDYMPICTELKNLCCAECYNDSEEASADYRANRDRYLRDLNENLLNEFTGSVYPEKYLNYTVWEPGGLGDLTIFNKGGLINYNMLNGCPECTFRIWTEIKWPALNNQTLAERFPTINVNTGIKFYWLPAVHFGNTPPTGQPGQLLKWANDPLDPTTYGEYAWDPVTNSWSEILAGILSDLNTTSRARRDAWIKAFNEILLANNPFLWANDYALLHRFKYELKYPV